MRTPRLFLGIFALALLLPLLLLACGGSDEPTDAPDSEPASAAPTDVPDSEHATGQPETPASLHTDEPVLVRLRQCRTHCHRCACTCGDGSGLRPPPAPPKSDREALVAFYNATNGENWDVQLITG